MQPLPTSVMLSADAYRRELLADWARTQPVRFNPAISKGSPTPCSRLRRTVGLAFVRWGERLLAETAIGPVGQVAATVAGPDAVFVS